MSTKNSPKASPRGVPSKLFSPLQDDEKRVRIKEPDELHSPFSLTKMTKKLIELRNKNSEDVMTYDHTEVLIKLENNLNFLNEKQLQFFVQKQLIGSMQSFFSQKKAAEMVVGEGQKIVDKYTRMVSLIERDKDMEDQQLNSN